MVFSINATIHLVRHFNLSILTYVRFVMGRARTLTLTALRIWPRNGPKPERAVLFLIVTFILALLTLHDPRQWELSGLPLPSIDLKTPPPPPVPEDTSNETIPHLPHVQKLCNETQWTEGLSLWCHSACGSNGKAFCGGLTNARSRLQTCVRWAIDAGASEMVVPHVVGRLADYRVDSFGDLICSDEWMDVPRLDAALGANCPQLRLRVCPQLEDEDADAESTTSARRVVIEGGRGWDQLDELGSHAGGFRELVGYALQSEGLDLASVSPAQPVVFRYGDSYLGWNYSASGELGTVQRELFRAINYQPDLVRMGNDILRHAELRSGSYIAVHFRGEADWPSDWGSAEDQMRLYTKEMERIRETEEGRDVKDVYVSCGDKKAIKRFRRHLKPLGFIVHDKSSILKDDGETLARIEALDFDRKAIVDYQLLSNAKYFMGVSFSLSAQPSCLFGAGQLLGKPNYLRGFSHRYLQAVLACLSLMRGA